MNTSRFLGLLTVLIVITTAGCSAPLAPSGGDGAGTTGLPSCSDGTVNDVRDCSCYWEAMVTGDFETTLSGTYAIFGILEVGELSTLNMAFSEHVGAVGAGGTASTLDLPRDATGEFDLFQLLVSDGALNDFSIVPGSPAVLTATSHTGGVMEGTIVATLQGPDPDDPTADLRQVTVSITFRASEDTIDNAPCLD